MRHENCTGRSWEFKLGGLPFLRRMVVKEVAVVGAVVVASVEHLQQENGCLIQRLRSLEGQVVHGFLLQLLQWLACYHQDGCYQYLLDHHLGPHLKPHLRNHHLQLLLLPTNWQLLANWYLAIVWQEEAHLLASWPSLYASEDNSHTLHLHDGPGNASI